jgi:hypothetical protein
VLEVLFIHITFAILLVLTIAFRFFMQLFFAKQTTFLKIPIIIVTILQVMTGVGLMFGGSSLAKVCVPGIVLIAVVFLSEITLKRLAKA